MQEDRPSVRLSMNQASYEVICNLKELIERDTVTLVKAADQCNEDTEQQKVRGDSVGILDRSESSKWKIKPYGMELNARSPIIDYPRRCFPTSPRNVSGILSGGNW